MDLCNESLAMTSSEISLRMKKKKRKRHDKRQSAIESVDLYGAKKNTFPNVISRPASSLI